MYLSKHKNDFYYIYYKQPNGKRTKVATKTKFKSEALKYLSRFELELSKRVELDYTQISLKKFAFEFLKHSESIHSKKTTRDYRQTFIFMRRYFNNPNLETLTTKQINEYLQHRIEFSSIYQGRKDLINLKSAFNFAVKNNYILTNPCNDISRIKTPEKQPLYFSKSELDKFLLSIDNDDFKDLVLLAVNTGLRQMELLTLTKEQIDLNSGIITLNNRTHITKSRKIRVIPLNATAREILNKRIALNPIFPFTADKTIKLMKKYREKAEIRNELSFHSLRHTFASWLVQKGVPILNVSKLLGHSDVKTTQIYAHVSNSELMSSVEMLN